MRLTENRRLAWVALALCVVLSVFVLGGAALGWERKKVLRVFNDGTDTSLDTRMSMDAYLDDLGENASIMANETELHLGQSDLTKSVQEHAKKVGDDLAGLDARSEAFTQLKDQVEKMYNSMYSQLSGDEFKNFKLAYDNFWGKKDLIDRDEYHKLAKGYNDLISGFPGGLVAAITRKGSLNTFGG